MTVDALKEPLKSIDLTERGALKSIDVYAIYTEGDQHLFFDFTLKEQIET